MGPRVFLAQMEHARHYERQPQILVKSMSLRRWAENGNEIDMSFRKHT